MMSYNSNQSITEFPTKRENTIMRNRILPSVFSKDDLFDSNQSIAKFVTKENLVAKGNVVSHGLISKEILFGYSRQCCLIFWCQMIRVQPSSSRCF